MNRNFVLFAVIAILFTSIGAYFGNLHRQGDGAQTATTSQLADPLFATSLPDLSNQNQALAQWKGKILLVNFWATWCTPCVQEMPELSALQSGAHAKNMQIIGIGVDSADNMREFSSKYKISYPLYVADMSGSALLRKLGDQAGGLPFSILIAPDGQVKKTYLGRLKMDEVQRDIAAL
jgi:thiol-disulfide isomerase/thioredoxin